MNKITDKNISDFDRNIVSGSKVLIDVPFLNKMSANLKQKPNQ